MYAPDSSQALSDTIIGVASGLVAGSPLLMVTRTPYPRRRGIGNVQVRMKRVS